LFDQWYDTKSTGLENAPETLRRLFEGRNEGKQLRGVNRTPNGPASTTFWSEAAESSVPETMSRLRKYRSFPEPFSSVTTNAVSLLRGATTLIWDFGRKLPRYQFQTKLELFNDFREFGAVPQTILIVEDEALVRVDAADFLRQGGYSVHEAANASDAMRSLQSKFTVDLLFTDINLSGIELALWALGNLPRVKILVTTGETLKALSPRVLGKILPKPYAYSDLLERVKHALATWSFGSRFSPTTAAIDRQTFLALRETP
jgi:CheY-like chemotaxis protein